ncbi:hypothetical protein [Rasiella sp. SM2506]|uniref:hypothetical protein n=1 Tax=Rasiella sp. SM2506 TaxID=3423914 RepID=UPI003D7AECA0
MGLFDFLKSKPKIKSDFIPGIGELIFSSELEESAYRGKINLANLEYKTEVVFPCDNKDISDYQISYFKEIDKNIKEILDFAAKMQDSKIELSKCKVICIMIPDRENISYDIDSEIVINQKEKNNIYGKSIYSLIMDKLKVVEIITI